MKAHVIKIIFICAAVILLFAGGFMCGRKSCPGIESASSIKNTETASVALKKETVTSPVKNTGTKLVSSMDYTLEMKMLQMIVNNEMPDTDFEDWTVVEFSKLPKFIRQVKGAHYQYLPREESCAFIYTYDLDHDEKKEMIVHFAGDSGNGGNGYHFFSSFNGKWQLCGTAFGTIVRPMSYNGHHGIFEKYRCGGATNVYSFLELANGKLTRVVEVECERKWNDKSTPDLSLKLRTKSNERFSEIF